MIRLAVAVSRNKRLSLISICIVLLLICGWSPAQKSIDDCFDENGCWRLYRVNLKDGFASTGDQWKEFGTSGTSTLNTNFVPNWTMYGYYTFSGFKSAVWLDRINDNQFQFASNGKMVASNTFLRALRESRFLVWSRIRLGSLCQTQKVGNKKGTMCMQH